RVAHLQPLRGAHAAHAGRAARHRQRPQRRADRAAGHLERQLEDDRRASVERRGRARVPLRLPAVRAGERPLRGGRVLRRGEGACHAHQIVLEILTETGGIGLALWLAAVVLAWRTWQRVGAVARERAFPVTLALGVMLFPLNTHLAFYSAWWGLL